MEKAKTICDKIKIFVKTSLVIILTLNFFFRPIHILLGIHRNCRIFACHKNLKFKLVFIRDTKKTKKNPH